MYKVNHSLKRYKKEDNIFLSFQAEKEINDNIIKDLTKLFKLKKENEAIKDRIIRYIKNIL